jgi:hypothetical protein
MNEFDIQHNKIIGAVDGSNTGLKIMRPVFYQDLSPEFKTYIKELQDKEAELDAVMQLGIDKWLDGKELEYNPATRATIAREKVLKIIEALEIQLPKKMRS